LVLFGNQPCSSEAHEQLVDPPEAGLNLTPETVFASTTGRATTFFSQQRPAGPLARPDERRSRADIFLGAPGLAGLPAPKIEAQIINSQKLKRRERTENWVCGRFDLRKKNRPVPGFNFFKAGRSVLERIFHFARLSPLVPDFNRGDLRLRNLLYGIPLLNWKRTFVIHHHIGWVNRRRGARVQWGEHGVRPHK
jgi:hypothetical protein